MEFESAISTRNQIELLQTAIQQLLESKRISAAQIHDEDDCEDRHLLAKLLSQLESLKADGVAKPSEPSAEAACKVASCMDETKPSASNTGGPGAEDVVKGLKKLERQNRITHWLLSALILLTAAWQLSEVSLLLKLKHGLTHPVKSFGSFVIGMFKGPVNGLEEEKRLSPMQVGAENRLKFAKDLQSLVMNDDQE